MIRKSFATIVAALLFVLAGCVVPVESSPDADTDNIGMQISGSGCAANQTVCYVWSGATQVAGTCVAAGTSGYSCCTGCVDWRGVCQTGTASLACGVSGIACASCDDAKECTVDTCSSGACSHTNSDYNVSCNRGGGRCDVANGTCCNGAFMSVYDVSTSMTSWQCVAACSGCTCRNPTTHVCEPAGFDCSCF